MQLNDPYNSMWYCSCHRQRLTATQSRGNVHCRVPLNGTLRLFLLEELTESEYFMAAAPPQRSSCWQTAGSLPRRRLQQFP